MPTFEMTELGAATGQCYVCFDEGAPRSVCNCTDRFVHTECMLRAIETSGRRVCAVCTAEFPNVEMKRTCRMSCRGKRFILFVMILPPLMVLGSWRSHQWLENPYLTRERHTINTARCIETVFELLIMVIMVLVVAADVFLYLKGQWRFLVFVPRVQCVRSQLSG